jgi:hypothetical protein
LSFRRPVALPPARRLPLGALGEQLAWLFEQLGGGAAELTVEEVRAPRIDQAMALGEGTSGRRLAVGSPAD